MTMSTTTKNEIVTWGQCEHHKHNHSIIYKWNICYDDYAVAVDGCICASICDDRDYWDTDRETTMNVMISLMIIKTTDCLVLILSYNLAYFFTFFTNFLPIICNYNFNNFLWFFFVIFRKSPKALVKRERKLKYHFEVKLHSTKWSMLVELLW